MVQGINLREKSRDKMIPGVMLDSEIYTWKS